MNPLVKLLHILSWVPLALIKLALILIGALWVIPLALIFDAGMMRTLWIWGNKEEGCPDWWLRRCERLQYGDDDKWFEKANKWLQKKFPCWFWFAVRNPVNNLRYVFDDREAKIDGWEGPMEAQNLIDAGVTAATRWAYSGPFAGYRKVTLEGDGKYSELWFGWKVGSKVPGMGFTTQWRKNVEIGQ